MIKHHQKNCLPCHKMCRMNHTTVACVFSYAMHTLWLDCQKCDVLSLVTDFLPEILTTFGKYFKKKILSSFTTYFLFVRHTKETVLNFSS